MDTVLVTGTAASGPPKQANRRWPARLATLFAWVLALLVVGLPVLAVGTVLVRATSDDRSRTDVIVVLGAAQYQAKPSPVLENRLGHARDLFADRVAAQIVTVGGRQKGDIATEGGTGRRWLLRAGISPDRVTAVREGADTLESLAAVAPLMRERGWKSATLVTDPAHLARSMVMASKLGIDVHGSGTTEGAGSGLTFEYVARESLGLLVFWVRDQWSIE